MVQSETIDKGLDYLKSLYSEEAIEFAINTTTNFKVETAAWLYWIGFGGLGDRFAASGGNPLGAARTTEEIAQDAGFVHSLTKSAPLVGQHILWQLVNDKNEPDINVVKRVKQELIANGVDIGSISPTYFVGPSEDGSFTAQKKEIRDTYKEQTRFAVKVAKELGNNLLTLCFPDGTNLPSQRHLQDKANLMRDNLVSILLEIPFKTDGPKLKVLVEYKLFEPGTYSTTIASPLDAYLLSEEITKRCNMTGGVLVDLGHHPHGTNIEGIVAKLIAYRIPGGFHFNTRYAADDDHPVEPNPTIARIFNELLYGDVIYNIDKNKNWTYALDQMPRAEERIPAALKSIEALKISIARASLAISRDSILRELQYYKELIGANREQENTLLLTDTRPIVWESYRRLGLAPDPLEAYRDSGYQQKIVEARNK